MTIQVQDHMMDVATHFHQGPIMFAGLPKMCVRFYVDHGGTQHVFDLSIVVLLALLRLVNY